MFGILLTTLCVLIAIALASNATNITPQLQFALLDQQKQFNGNIQNFLIHPSKNMFAEYILTYLSPQGVFQTYEHFKKSYSNLNLPTFLETYHIQSTIVLGFEEEYIFYPFLEKYTSHSLFSKKNKIPVTFASFINPNPRIGEVFALLPSKKIIPFQFRTFFSQNGLMVAKNPKGYDFFIALSKTNGEYSVVAHGVAHGINISQNLHLIWTAHRRSQYETFSLKFTHRITIPYLRYLRFCQFCCTNLHEKYFAETCCLVKRIFKLACYFFVYTTTRLPFMLVVFFVEFLTGFHKFFFIEYCKNSPYIRLAIMYSEILFAFVIFAIITWRFIVRVYDSFCVHVWLHPFDPEHLNIFAIKPQKLMWRFPYLIQQKNPPTCAQKIFCAFWLFLLHFTYLACVSMFMYHYRK